MHLLVLSYCQNFTANHFGQKFWVLMYHQFFEFLAPKIWSCLLYCQFVLYLMPQQKLMFDHGFRFRQAHVKLSVECFTFSLIKLIMQCHSELIYFMLKNIVSNYLSALFCSCIFFENIKQHYLNNYHYLYVIFDITWRLSQCSYS